MGDVMSGLGQLGGNLLSGAQTLGSDVMSGIQDVGSSIGGLFGGGGAVSPGTLGAAGASIANAAPSALGSGVDAVANVAAPAAATDAATMMTGPGIGALDTSTIGAGVQGLNTNVGALEGMSPTFMPTVSGPLNTALASPGLDAVPGINPPMGGQGVTLEGGAPNVAGLSNPNFLQSLLKNPELMKAIIPGAGLIRAMTEQPPGLKDLKAMEAQQAGMAKNQSELAMGEQQGLLPQGATNLMQGQLNAAEAAIRAKYAQMGMTGSTAETEDLAAARDATIGEILKQGQTMATQSWNNYNTATSYQSDLMNSIISEEMAKDKDFQTAMAELASSLTK